MDLVLVRRETVVVALDVDVQELVEGARIR
jgi:hypothetical protein